MYSSRLVDILCLCYFATNRASFDVFLDCRPFPQFSTTYPLFLCIVQHITAEGTALVQQAEDAASSQVCPCDFIPCTA